MKKLLFLLIILFISCKNNDEALSIVKQNNSFLKEELENMKLLLKVKSEENPYRIEDYKTIKTFSNAIYNLKDKEDYNKILIQIKRINSKSIAPINLESINSENPEILKNNLFLKVNKLFKISLKKWNIEESHCGLDFTYSIKKEKLNDSVSFKFKTVYYDFNIKVDSIIENGKIVKKEIHPEQYKLTTFKYKSDAKNSVFYGKVIINDVFENPYIVKNIKETFNK